VLGSSAELPLPTMPAAQALAFRSIPSGPVQIGTTFLKAVAHNASPVDPSTREAPQLNLAFHDARWFLLSRLDSATVGTADGRGVTFRQRDPKTFRRLAAESARLLRQISQRFPDLQERYRAAGPDLVSPERWAEAFETWGYRKV
jgi:galactofuranosylgalactofuranosylrhamnosyl-N-acetylglucosaminyl-diphospho-decaprenol beta-1,5/1,6-galactofuranosyltransferase